MRTLDRDRIAYIGGQLGLGRTFQWIADTLGISRQRVHQIWKARKQAYEDTRKCKVCGNDFVVTHQNQIMHRACAKDRQAWLDKLGARRRAAVHALTLPGNGGKLTVGLIKSRLQRGWTWQEATTLPKGTHRGSVTEKR